MKPGQGMSLGKAADNGQRWVRARKCVDARCCSSQVGVGGGVGSSRVDVSGRKRAGAEGARPKGTSSSRRSMYQGSAEGPGRRKR